MKKRLCHRTSFLILVLLSLTNCTSFAKSPIWLGENLEINSQKDPMQYGEAERLEYKNYRQYLKSLDRLHQKRLLEQIEKDKSVKKTFSPETKK